jgi:hypothetical protein
MGKRQIGPPNAKMGRQIGAAKGVGGQFCHFSNNSTMKQYFKMSYKDVSPVVVLLTLFIILTSM